MTPDRFFGGRWKGEGQVRGLSGRVLRRFVVSFDGAWSESNRAFHVDERIAYADGRSLDRHWVVHTDETGALVGSDDRAGRMRVDSQFGGFRIRYDRPRGIGRSPGVASISLEIRDGGAGRIEGFGVTRVLGLPVAWTSVQFEAVAPDPAPGR